MLQIMDEFETLRAAANGRNLARFGDGELRLAIGGKAISQQADPKLSKELRQILAGDTKAIACIPPIYPPRPGNQRMKFWAAYQDPRFMMLYGSQEFGSSFVTRPDSAPNIDTPEYWNLVASLWRGRDVLYITGGDSHLPPIMKAEANYLSMFQCEKQNAYGQIDQLVNECRIWQGTVLLAAGAAGTVIAHRLASIGVHAVDIGHMGMFYTVKGAYAMKPEELASDYYRKQLKEAHAVRKWGGGGYSWAEAALAYRDKIGAKNILDYGCGRGTFKKKATELDPDVGVMEYDPGIEGKEAPPKPADLVVCTDVLEHIEPACIDNVLAHIFAVGRKGAFLVICTKPANKILPDGRNAHLIIEGMNYWKLKIDALGYAGVEYEEQRGGKLIVVRCAK